MGQRDFGEGIFGDGFVQNYIKDRGKEVDMSVSIAQSKFRELGSLLRNADSSKWPGIYGQWWKECHDFRDIALTTFKQWMAEVGEKHWTYNW